MRLLIFLLAILGSPASAIPPESPASATTGEEGQQPAPEPLPEPPRLQTPAERLEEAVLNYQTNRHGLAMQQLAILSIDPDIDASVRQDARVYLGELLYIQGDTEGAKQLFEQVLIEDSGYEIDRFRHPPDVCGHFEYVRTYIVPTSTPTPPAMVIRPLPPAGYAPFAAYQFKHTTSGRWPLFLGQIGFGVSSAALFGVLLSNRSYLETDTDAQQRVAVLRATQFTTTAGFYGMWLLSGLDARRHWRVNLAVQPATEGVSFIGGATLTR
ncbi:MAG: hypothetical protein P8R54_21015 [Myxococcota bacterium]|nr:hypothetical protein [Myxococcota bacterium]